VQLIRLLLAGLKKPEAGTTTTGTMTKASGLVAAISRSGNPAEVLQGPFIYTIVLLLATVFYWRTNVVSSGDMP